MELITSVTPNGINTVAPTAATAAALMFGAASERIFAPGPTEFVALSASTKDVVPAPDIIVVIRALLVAAPGAVVATLHGTVKPSISGEPKSSNTRDPSVK